MKDAIPVDGADMALTTPSALPANIEETMGSGIRDQGPGTRDRGSGPVRVSSPTRARASLLNLLLPLAILVVGFGLNSFRLMESVDLTSDEATYAIESVALHRTGMTQWNGTPFLVHPPLFFATEAAVYAPLGVGNSPLFDRLLDRGYTAGEALLPADAPLNDDNILNAIMIGRYLNAFYGAVLTLIVFFFGRALLDVRVGLLGAVLFALDPYVAWRNHFNYLEPLFTIFGVLAIYSYYRAQTKDDKRQRVRQLALAGLFFGLGMLTKELALLYFAAIVVHAVLFRRERFREVLIPFFTGMTIYAIFPLWTAISGNFDIWWETKTWLYRRVTGQIVDSGIDRPGVPLANTLAVNLPDYWPWFLVLAIVPLLTAAFLYLYYRRGLRDTESEVLAACVIGSYSFFLVVRVLGGVINEQYFYSLMPFVVLSLAYAAFGAPHLIGGRWSGIGDRGLEGSRPDMETIPLDAVKPARVNSRPASRFAQVLLGGLALLIAYNTFAWTLRYVLGKDNSYAQVEVELSNSLAPGTFVVGRDLLDLYLMPKQNVYTFSTLNLVGRSIDPANVLERRIPYAILNDQSLSQRYGGANPRYYDWVRENGEEIVKFQGRKYATSVYKMDYSRPAGTFGGDSMARGRPASASSAENAIRFTPDNAFDSFVTTRWASNETENEWIYVDLGEKKRISRVELYWEEAFARRYALQSSDDGVSWTTFYETEKGAGGIETIEAEGEGRYVRLLMSQRGTDAGYSLWEIAIYP